MAVTKTIAIRLVPPRRRRQGAADMLALIGPTLVVAYSSPVASAASSAVSQAEGGRVVRQTLVIEEWIVDYLRPTVREVPVDIDESRRAVKFLINGSYPGPAIHANEDDMLEITVVNKLFSEATTIHWHGIHPLRQPYMDGARDVTQAPILPGQNFTYRFSAYPPGTHYYHSHMDAVQGARGIRGPLIIQRKADPVKEEFAYDEDLVVFMSDEWRDPSACLKLEGAMPGNDVCADIRHGSFSGKFGNGSAAFPFPLITVKADTCYRVRWVMAGSNTENFQITVAGHNMTLVSVDGGYDVRPVQVQHRPTHKHPARVLSSSPTSIRCGASTCTWGSGWT